jgi:hypothetical protein
MLTKTPLTKPPAGPSGPKPAVKAAVLLTAFDVVPVAVLLLLPPQPASTSKHIAPSKKGAAITLD